MIDYEDCRIWTLGVTDNLLNVSYKHLESDYLN